MIIRNWRTGAAIAFILVVLSATHAAAGVRIAAVEAIGITVSDLDRSVVFYTDVLGFRKQSEAEVFGDEFEHLTGVFGARARVARLTLGDEKIDLIEYLAPRGRPVPVDSRSNDRWFQHIAIIVRDMDEAYRWLRVHRVEHASSGPQLLPDWNPNAGGISAFYFRDPDGNHLEILHFPPDKGSGKWHRKTKDLFLGIDHTAIVVDDTDASLDLYRGLLGMEIAGTSENFGIEQERLNNVFGARLRITALRATDGPGIELLEYLAPRNGRAMPEDTAANDLWHWQTTLSADGLSGVEAALHEGRYRFVSPGSVDLASSGLDYQKGLMFRDADGHAFVVHAKEFKGAKP